MTHCGNIFVYLQYTWFLIVNLTNNLLTGFFCYLFSNFGTRHTDLRINVEKYMSCKKTAEYEKKTKKIQFSVLCVKVTQTLLEISPKKISFVGFSCQYIQKLQEISDLIINFQLYLTLCTKNLQTHLKTFEYF